MQQEPNHEQEREEREGVSDPDGGGKNAPAEKDERVDSQGVKSMIRRMSAVERNEKAGLKNLREAEKSK